MKPLLSILTPSLVTREAKLQKLMAFLQPQCAGKPVELLVDVDNYERTTGAKRNSLLERATGEYVVFFDDDDEYAPDCVDLILSHLGEDVVGITVGVRYAIGAPPKDRAVHSIRYDTFFRDAKGIYCRPPTHTTPMRREIMMAVPFPDTCLFEDVAHSIKLAKLGLYKTENFCEKQLFIYGPAGAPEHHGKANQPKPGDRERILKEYGGME